MRKKIVGENREGLSDEGGWLDLEARASAEISSEDA